MRRQGSALLALALLAAAPAPRIGVEMPAAGDDGARGLAAVTAVRLALGTDRLVVRDSARGGALNPHQDEGSDNDVDLRTAPALIAAFAADPSVVAALGGLRRNVGDADAAAADAYGLPTIVLARWSRGARGANAFCLCVSPPRLVAFARGTARRRFGSRVLLVLIGAASTLPAAWPDRFGAVAISVLDSAPATLAVARRRALDADAVLVLADERPPALWRAAAFRRAFDCAYLRDLEHRDFQLAAAGTRRGDELVLSEELPAGPARDAFARRFHAVAGYAPDDDALRAYAAAQIVRSAGSSREQARRALAERRFVTAAGLVSFDGDGYWGNVVLLAAEV